MPDEDIRSKLQTTKDYYYILGVRPDATSEEIEEAFQDLNEKFGPHVNISGQDPDILIKTFKDISDAYTILMDPARRREYDKLSANHRHGASELRALWTKSASAPPAPQPGQQGQAVSSGTSWAGVGGDPDRAPKIQALALEVEVDVTLREALKGCKRQIPINDPKPCPECSQQRGGKTMQCPGCRGVGYLKVERNQEIDLPAGLYDDMEISLPAMGRYDMRAQRNGDLIVRVKLKKHPVLGVLGRDITLTAPVTIYEAMLGGEIEVPCATGKVVMKLQPLSQPGRVYRLKGLGLAGADQLVTIEIALPQTLSGEEVNLYRKLKELSKDPHPRDALVKLSQQHG
jgi:DnaJ-class molecular chaperone